MAKLGSEIDESQLRKFRLPWIGTHGTGEVIDVRDKRMFGVAVAKILQRFKGYNALYHEGRMAGVLENIRYDGVDLTVHAKAEALSHFFSPGENSFQWFTVRNLRRIELQGPGWGAAAFGSVVLFVSFWGQEKHSLQLAGRKNGSFIGVQGAYPVK